MSSANRNILSAASVLAILLVGPAVPTHPQDRGASVIRSTTRLVQLNVEVLDKQGKPVGSLSRDDFQVLDNGNDQKLSHFSVTSSVVGGTRSPASPLVITNRPQQDGGDALGSVTIIVVEEYVDHNVRMPHWDGALQYARLEVMKFLATLQPGEQVALYAMRPEGLVVIHDLTDDSAALIAAAKALGTGQLKGKTLVAGSELRTMAAWMGTLRDKQTANNEDLSRVLVGEAFSAIAKHLQGSPRRMNAIWISSNFPSLVSGSHPGTMLGERDTILPDSWGASLPVFANTESDYDMWRRWARRLSNANISLYPMDAKGLANGGYTASQCTHCKYGEQAAAPGPSDASFHGSVVNMNSAYVPLPPGSVSDLFGKRQTMELLASETGGRAFYDTNALGEHMREVLEESRVTYVLAYYPGDSAWDGMYHHVEVKLKRPGLTVRCRKGYFALDKPLTPYQDGGLREAAKGLLESSGIGVTLNVSSNPLEWFMQDVVVKLDTQEIHFENSGGRWRAQIQVVFVQLAKDGRILDDIKDDLELALYPRTYNEATAQGWFYPKSIFVKPEAEKLRVVVRDHATGDVGSVSVPVRHDKAS
jgi:VWFA-related protein